MEDADRIVLDHLKQVGCNFSIESLRDLQAEQTLEAVAKLLKTIVPNFSVPVLIPHNMVAKYNTGIKLAEMILSLGYKGELGYQSFMYSNADELRRIFSFLIEKISKEEKSLPLVQANGLTFRQALASALTEELEKPWLPSYARCRLNVYAVNHTADQVPSRWPKVFLSSAKIFDCTDRRELIHNLLQANAASQAGIGSLADDEFEKITSLLLHMRISSPFENVSCHSEVASSYNENSQDNPVAVHSDSAFRENIKDIHATSDVFKEESDQSIKPTLPTLQSKATSFTEVNEQSVTAQIAALFEEHSQLESQLNELTYEVENAQASLEDLEADALVNRDFNRFRQMAATLVAGHQDSSSDALESAESRCHELVKAAQSKSFRLAAEWEEHRQPLMNELRELRLNNSARSSAERERRARLERLRAQRERMIEEHQLKRELIRHLHAEWSRLNAKLETAGAAATTQRSSYLARICEIVVSVVRQREEINKVLIDYRKQQREVNVLSERLERTFAAAELFFTQQPSKVDDATKAHRFINDIHNDCKNIVKAVEANGTILREIRELEEKINKERESKVLENLQRITADYQQVKTENDAIEGQLRNNRN